MPLLYLSFKHDSDNRNGNSFNFILPNEIPVQNVQVKDATVVLGGSPLQYGTTAISSSSVPPVVTNIRLPNSKFGGFNGTRVWLQFVNGDILNPRQILSNSSSEAGKIPLPMNYFQGRDKYQYNYMEQGFHIHGIDRSFDVNVFLDDGSTPAVFGDSLLNNICSIDLVLEYDEVN